MPTTAYKRCPRCERTLPRHAFAKDASKASGHKHICKPCDAARPRKRREHARLVFEPRACETCGESYAPHRRDQRYCTSDCHRKRRETPDTIVTCGFCRKLFLKPAREVRRSPKHFCNKACAGRARLGGTSVDLVGPITAGVTRPTTDAPTVRRFTARQCRCGEWITALGQRVPRTCGNCEVQRVFVSGPCHECGEQFTAAYFLGAVVPRFCSDTCAKRNRRRRDKQMRSKRIRDGARREVIDIGRLAMRDGWRCHICKRKVTRKTWSHDHLIPLSDGGSHTYDNVALAHHSCNTQRGVAGQAQLRLAA